MTALSNACAAWQGGRDGGSQPIRAGARLLTATKHYFESPFIDDYERDAAASPVTLECAATLLDAVASAERQDARGWATSVGLDSDVALRGIKSGDQDPQIVASLATGRIAMPLWGVTLDPGTASKYGGRFLFELVGEFPVIPAWVHSGITAAEQELIVGGTYEVLDQVDLSETTTHARLRFVDVVPAASEPMNG